MRPASITGIDHWTILVTEIERTRAFYTGILGLPEIPPPREFDFTALWFRVGPQMLHALLKPQPDTMSPRHIALMVPELNSWRDFLLARRCVVQETVRLPMVDRCFTYDPDGNRIELMAWLRPYQPQTDGAYKIEPPTGFIGTDTRGDAHGGAHPPNPNS